MNRTNARKLILSNGLVASVALFVWMVTSGMDVTTAYGATKPIPFTYDRGVFNITDLSIKEGSYSSDDLIGFIQNVDPYMNTIKGLSLKIEMYDRNNHLIDVVDSGYSSLPSDFRPQEKSAFKIPIDKNNELDHLNIRILATDWGTSITYPNVNQTRTFEDCYSDNVVAINGTSTERQIIINFTDPALKTLITNFCNFYHDKTGLWVSPSTSNGLQYADIFTKYGTEFEQKYGHTYPESIKQILDLDYGTNSSGDYSSDRPYLGIVGLSLTPDLSKQAGLNQTKGFLITSITEGSPADKYGLRAGTNRISYHGRDVNFGDVVLKIDNQSVSKIDDITAYVSQKHVGDKVHITFLRHNEIGELDLILGEPPNQPPYQPTSQTGGNESQEQLYNECVNVAGKSLCDFLFKR